MTRSCFSLTVHVWLPLLEFLTAFKCLQNMKLIYCTVQRIRVCIAHRSCVGVWFQREDYVFTKAKDACISVFLLFNMNWQDKYMVEQSNRTI